MFCINRNTPEFKKALEEAGGNYLWAHYKVLEKIKKDKIKPIIQEDEELEYEEQEDEKFGIIKKGVKYEPLLSYAKEYIDEITKKYGISKYKGKYYYHLSPEQTRRARKYGSYGKVGSALKGFNLQDDTKGIIDYRIEANKDYLYIEVMEYVTVDGIALPETVAYLRLPATIVASDELKDFKESVDKKEKYKSLLNEDVKKYLFKTRGKTTLNAARTALRNLEGLVIDALKDNGIQLTLDEFRNLPEDQRNKYIDSLGIDAVIEKTIKAYQDVLDQLKPEELKEDIINIFSNNPYISQEAKENLPSILNVVPIDLLKLITFESFLDFKAYFKKDSQRNKFEIPPVLNNLKNLYDLRSAYAMNVALRNMVKDGLATEEEIKELNKKLIPKIEEKISNRLPIKGLGKYKLIVANLKNGKQFRKYWDEARQEIENTIINENKGLVEMLVVYSKKATNFSKVFTEIAIGDLTDNPYDPNQVFDPITVFIHELGHAIDFYMLSTFPEQERKIKSFITDLVGRKEFATYIKEGLEYRGYTTDYKSEIMADMFAWIVGKAAGYDVTKGHLKSLDDFFRENWDLANDIYKLHFDLDFKKTTADNIIDWMKIMLNKIIDKINKYFKTPVFKPFTDSSTGIEVFPSFNNYHVNNLFNDIKTRIQSSEVYDIGAILRS